MKSGKGAHLLGNQIDKLLQSMNDGQTHGIPIGPDTSLIVAELLLAAVDAELIKRCGADFRGFRYVDDYELSFKTLKDAESFLVELQNILGEYQLILNPRKTRFDELPLPLEDSWAAELAKFPIRDATSPKGQRNDLVALFSHAFELASDRPEEPVIKYAVARVQTLDVASDAWRAFQNCVVGAASVDPSAMAMALGTLFLTAQKGGQTIAKAPLEEVFEATIERHARRGEGSEVSWALWGAITWNIPLSNGVAKALSAMEDDIVALLALDAESRGLFPTGSLNKNTWQSLVSQPDALDKQHWLLTYEATMKKWLSSPLISKNPVFKSMQSNGVTFYDSKRNVPHFPSAARRNPGGSLSSFYA
jgi:hypothetical protein